jgi:hypothetical protein
MDHFLNLVLRHSSLDSTDTSSAQKFDFSKNFVVAQDNDSLTAHTSNFSNPSPIDNPSMNDQYHNVIDLEFPVRKTTKVTKCITKNKIK